MANLNQYLILYYIVCTSVYGDVLVDTFTMNPHIHNLFLIKVIF